MGARYLTDLADVLRAAGLAVVEQDGWQTRARGSGGYDSGRPVAVAWHHTASSSTSTAAADAHYMSFTSENRPVANLLIARDGTVWVLAAGATNTEGQGGPLTLPSGVTIPTNEANARVIGMEIQNSGVGEAYRWACTDAAFRTSLACAAAYGLGPDDVFTHALGAGDGWTSRKIDPATADAVEGWFPDAVTSSGTWSQADLRAELLVRAASAAPQPPEDPDMTPQQYDDLMTAVQSTFALVEQLHPKVDARALEQSVQDTFTTAQSLHPKVDGIADAVDRLAP